MRGIADGAGVALLSIVALNVRTEINFGLFSDGCTALSWHTEKRAYLGQNWDVSQFNPTFFETPYKC
jgi:isopenicillin-N N-acyltransferase-like protein